MKISQEFYSNIAVNRTWYSKTINKNSPDAIHQVLAFGTLEDIRSLKATAGEEKIIEFEGIS